MKVLTFVLVLVGLAAALPSGPVNPDITGAQVFRVNPTSAAHLHYLYGLFMQDLYDFWTEPRAVGKNVDIMAQRWMVPVLKATLSKVGIEHTVIIRDLAEMTERSKIANDRALEVAKRTNPNPKHNMDWTAYHRLDDIYGYMDYLATTYSDIAQVESYGKTFEGRDMKMLKLSKGGSGKPIVFIDGGIHAREWISTATVSYMMSQMVENSGSHAFLDKVDFYFLPTINPDGYEFSHTNNRYWRKTRSATGSPFGCKGVDPNRNWDFHWDEVGTSNEPCSDIYSGSKAFSEVEMRNVRDQLNKYADKIKVYLTFHAFSQLWMYPWGYTSALPADWKDLDNLAFDAVEALTSVYGTLYEIGSSTNTIYAAAGGSDDWGKGVAGIKYTYTVELRDTGNYGFLLPPSQITPTGKETLEGVKVVGEFVAKTYG
ncbi:carboxypeptidase B-like [Oratosquilla oratoria]|uniref:carboxypeptidase B-like n=1 Tax=Oratosquilla oratoria TaxID=337810 RepID=UPI003F76EA48